jgi:hypothetical protein
MSREHRHTQAQYRARKLLYLLLKLGVIGMDIDLMTIYTSWVSKYLPPPRKKRKR